MLLLPQREIPTHPNRIPTGRSGGRAAAPVEKKESSPKNRLLCKVLSAKGKAPEVDLQEPVFRKTNPQR